MESMMLKRYMGIATQHNEDMYANGHITDAEYLGMLTSLMMAYNNLKDRTTISEIDIMLEINKCTDVVAEGMLGAVNRW